MVRSCSVEQAGDVPLRGLNNNYIIIIAFVILVAIGKDKNYSNKNSHNNVDNNGYSNRNGCKNYIRILQIDSGIPLILGLMLLDAYVFVVLRPQGFLSVHQKPFSVNTFSSSARPVPSITSQPSFCLPLSLLPL